jgi:anti-anti-sigma regulatory factor
VLLKAMDMAEERGGVMKVVKSSEFVREILAAVGFDKLFEVA